MKSLFETSTREELISRINSITENNKAQWGKMNVYQMLQHCTSGDDMYQGKLKIPRVFIGRLIGPMFLKKVLKDEKAFGKNSPTSTQLKFEAKAIDIENQKKEWINRIQAYHEIKTLEIVHPFFGRMKKEQIGQLAYKHADHHLRQFEA
ncbi:MAG: DUF1569 domain-containing protein [Bacteroidia bacterium]